MQHINLETFANGAFTAQVNRAIEEVTKNIQDPNTDAGTARKITVTIAFKPNQERNFIATLFMALVMLHKLLPMFVNRKTIVLGTGMAFLLAQTLVHLFHVLLLLFLLIQP